MLKRFLGNNGTREHGPSIQVLADEQENAENAIKLATEGHGSQPVPVDGKCVLFSNNNYGGVHVFQPPEINSVV